MVELGCHLEGGRAPGQDTDRMKDALVTQVAGVHTHIVPQLFTSKYDLDLALATEKKSWPRQMALNSKQLPSEVYIMESTVPYAFSLKEMG